MTAHKGSRPRCPASMQGWAQSCGLGAGLGITATQLLPCAALRQQPGKPPCDAPAVVAGAVNHNVALVVKEDACICCFVCGQLLMPTITATPRLRGLAKHPAGLMAPPATSGRLPLALPPQRLTPLGGNDNLVARDALDRLPCTPGPRTVCAAVLIKRGFPLVVGSCATQACTRHVQLWRLRRYSPPAHLTQQLLVVINRQGDVVSFRCIKECDARCDGLLECGDALLFRHRVGTAKRNWGQASSQVSRRRHQRWCCIPGGMARSAAGRACTPRAASCAPTASTLLWASARSQSAPMLTHRMPSCLRWTARRRA